jgi:hypothetical protein
VLNSSQKAEIISFVGVYLLKQNKENVVSITFLEQDGKLAFYDEKREFANKWDPCEVPAGIVKRGRIAINDFVERKIQKHIRSEKKAQNQRVKNIKNPNLAYKFDYLGVVIQGRVTDARPWHFTIQLEKPFKAEYWTSFNCYGAAMAGHFVFDDDGEFTDYVKGWCQEKLEEMFLEEKRKRKHSKTISLAKKLNSKKRRK